MIVLRLLAISLVLVSQNVEVLSLMHGYPPLMFRLKCSFLPITDSITRCAKITQEFRGENVVSDWKDDVLQLNNMMWYVECLSVTTPLRLKRQPGYVQVYLAILPEIR